MELIKSLVIAAALGMLTESSMASVEPYVGLGYEWTTANHRRGDSHASMFNKYFGGSSVYIGARCKDISIEAGYESTGKKNKTGYHSAISKELEVVTASVISLSNFEGWHIDLNNYLLINGDCELINSLGYGYISHRHATNLILQASGKPIFTESLNVSGKNKHSFRLGAGIQQMFCNHIGIRCMVRYKMLNNRSKFYSKFLSIKHNVKYKNIVSITAGVIFKF
jgi:opacity protein-like surface antigen